MKYEVGSKVVLRNQNDRMLRATALDMQRKYGDGPFTVTAIETVGEDERLQLEAPNGRALSLTEHEYRYSGSLFFMPAKKMHTKKQS